MQTSLRTLRWTWKSMLNVKMHIYITMKYKIIIIFFKYIIVEAV